MQQYSSPDSDLQCRWHNAAKPPQSWPGLLLLDYLFLPQNLMNKWIWKLLSPISSAQHCNITGAALQDVIFLSPLFYSMIERNGVFNEFSPSQHTCTGKFPSQKCHLSFKHISDEQYGRGCSLDTVSAPSLRSQQKFLWDQAVSWSTRLLSKCGQHKGPRDQRESTLGENKSFNISKKRRCGAKRWSCCIPQQRCEMVNASTFINT